jgi:rhodanese-related sulfurtransferase
LGGLTQIEPEAIPQVAENDRTAVFIDARETAEFAGGAVPHARNIPFSKLIRGKDVGEIKAAKDDGRLPMNDHNTRIIVFGKSIEQARAVAQAIAMEAFHNVSYFEGGMAEFKAAMISH